MEMRALTAKNIKPHERELIKALWSMRHRKYSVITMDGEKARRLARKLENAGIVHIIWCAEKGAPRKRNGLPRLTLCCVGLSPNAWEAVKPWLAIWRKEERCARTGPASLKKAAGSLPLKPKSLCARRGSFRSSKRELVHLRCKTR